MTCPYLEYRDAADGRSFDVERAYCAAAERFVQPMRADICNDRYGLAHERDCEIYLAAESTTSEGPNDTDGSAGEPDGGE